MALNRTTVGLGAGVGIVALVLLWYLFRPELLFVNTTVNEAAPVAAAIAAPTVAPAMAATSAIAAQPTAPAAAPAAVVEPAAEPAAEPVATTPPSNAPVWSGSFQSLAHETSGTAQALALADGSRVLRFEQFTTSNGPDVRVYLVRGGDGTQDEAIKNGDFIDLGALKGNVGDQNYAILAEVDLSQYQSVSLWCRRFNVNFGATSLSTAP